MTLLAAMQDLMAKKGMPVPSALIASTDPAMVQLRAIIKEAVEFLGTFPWQQTQSRVSVTAPAGADLGTLDSLFGSDLFAFDRGSLWDVTNNRPILGPVDETVWQTLQSQPAGGPEKVYRVMGDHLHVWPAMAGTETISAICRSRWVVVDPSAALKETISNDLDTFVFPEAVLKKQVEWRWLKEKGEPWTATYEEAKALTGMHLAGRGAGARLQLDTTAATIAPGIYIPAGSWSL